MITDAVDSSRLVDPAAWREGVPHAAFDWLRENAPISWHEPETGPYWALTRHADIATVSKNWQQFTVEQGNLYPRPSADTLAAQKDMLTVTDPPQHDRLRKLAAKSFTPRVVGRFEGWIREVVDKTLDSVAERSEFDFVPEVATRIPALVVASILGIHEDEEREFLLGCIVDIFSMDKPNGAELHLRGLQNLAGFVMQKREYKLANPADDVMSTLNAAHDDNGVALTPEEYMKFVSVLIAAGFETTQTLMAQGLALMLEDPEIAASVGSAIDTGKSMAAIEEMLRFIAPINYTARIALADVEVSGTTIREGQMVLQWYAAANRDPEVFANPHRFDVGRSRNPHMAFGGGGIHHCLGNHIARLETRIMFEQLHARRTGLELAGRPERAASLFTNQLASLPVRRR